MEFYINLSATPEETYYYLYFTKEEIEAVCIGKHSGWGECTKYMRCTWLVLKKLR